MKNQLLLTTILCGCSLTAWSAVPIANPWPTTVNAAETTSEETTGEYTLAAENGSYTSGGSSWASVWESSQEGPKVKLSCGKNNMDVANSKNGVFKVYAGQAGSDTYNVAIEDGYIITSISFDFVSAAEANPVKVLPCQGDTLTSSMTSQHFEAKDLKLKTVKAFFLTGGNYGIAVSNFKITYKKFASNGKDINVSLANGAFTKPTTLTSYASEWTSFQVEPTIKLDCGVNNIDVKNSTSDMLRVYAGSKNTATYNLIASEGYRITGYSFDFVKTSGSTAATVTDVKGDAKTSGDASQHIEVTGLASDTIAAFVLSGGNYGIDITNFKVNFEKIGDTPVVDPVDPPTVDPVDPVDPPIVTPVDTLTFDFKMESGAFTAKNSGNTWGSAWKSTQKDPYFTLSCGWNNIDIANSVDGKICAYVGSQSSSTDYTMTIQKGWKIIGYSFDFVRVTGNDAITVTDAKGNKFTSSDEVQHVVVEDIDTLSLVPFNLSGANKGIQITNFKVSYRVDTAYVAPDLHTFTVFDNTGSVPYRIPAIGTAFDGSLVAVADYRYSKADIGSGRVDLHIRISHDNGLTWGDVMDLEQFRGDGNLKEWRHDKAAYGDPCIVGDRESSRMMITSCSGFPGFFDKTDRHQGWARWYSDDNGQTWSEPEYIDMKYVYEPLAKVGHPVQGFFVGSGKIFQSRYIKRGQYYRLYCAGSTQQNGGNKENWVFYSDDFGETWDFLGGCKKAPIVTTADEPKVEELPDGSVILSSRDVSGRYYNIFTFSGNDGISGSWADKALSSSAVKGLTANNGCNGEIQIVPVVRKADGEKTFIALQSLPTSGRTNVTIFYKDLTDATTYSSPANFAKDWDGKFVVCEESSAYSTWSWQQDNALAFLYEEGGGTSGGYNIVYKRIDIPTLTDGKYDFDASRTFERTDIDWTQSDLNHEMGALVDSVKAGVDVNTVYLTGDKLITNANQLECKFGVKETGGTGNDANDISTLIDGDPATYYHTQYSAGDQPNGSHYMDVTAAEGSAFEGTIKVDVTRRSGASADHITEFTITGWNNESDSTQIAVVSVPNPSAGAQASCMFTIPEGKSYQHLRFNVTGTTNNRGYWHMAEFQFYPYGLDPKCLNVLHPEAYQTISEAIETAVGLDKVTAESIQQLKDAYAAYLAAINATADGVGAVKVVDGSAAATIYDIQGRRVQQMGKGVYILNGKKVIR